MWKISNFRELPTLELDTVTMGVHAGNGHSNNFVTQRGEIAVHKNKTSSDCMI
jgi:hypothetical protein